MKKVIAFICILTLCFSLCACGKTEISEESNHESISEESNHESISEENNSDIEIREEGDWRTITKVNGNGAVDAALEYMSSFSDDSVMSSYLRGGHFALYSKPLEHTKPNIIPADTDEGNIDIDGITTLMPAVNNSISLYDLISECEGRTVFEQLYMSRVSYTLSAMYATTVPNQYGVTTNFLRQNDEGTLYTVKKYNCGGYLYSFYDHPYFKVQQSDDEDKYYPMGGVYVENVLSYSDFIDIKIGDNILDVEEIDSATAFWRLVFGITSSDENYMEMDGKYAKEDIITTHLLTDGLLTINYELRESGYVVSNITYSEEFIYDSDYLYEHLGEHYYKSFKILPQDYPPAN